MESEIISLLKTVACCDIFFAIWCFGGVIFEVFVPFLKIIIEKRKNKK